MDDAYCFACKGLSGQISIAHCRNRNNREENGIYYWPALDQPEQDRSSGNDSESERDQSAAPCIGKCYRDEEFHHLAAGNCYLTRLSRLQRKNNLAVAQENFKPARVVS
jgi:hypothetical protein